MTIEGVIWHRDIINKLSSKHHVEVHEVEEVFSLYCRYRSGFTYFGVQIAPKLLEKIPCRLMLRQIIRTSTPQ